MFRLNRPSRNTAVLALLALLVLITVSLAYLWTRRTEPSEAAEPAFTNEADEGVVGTNLSVFSIAPAEDGRTFIGGNFTFAGDRTGHGGWAIFDEDGNPIPDLVRANSSVFAGEPDGNGGWFLGGTFSTIDGQTRNRLAHILPDGSLDPDWVANTTAATWGLQQIDAMVLDTVNDILYVGGSFATINGVATVGVAGLDPATGTVVKAWSPGTNQHVSSLILDGTTLYVGGHFTTFAGVAHTRLFAINTTTNLATAWAPSVNNNVRSMALNSGSAVMYIGGTFTSAGGQSRNRIAAINTGTNLATAWNPNANNSVESLLFDGTTLFAGGNFTTIGGQTRTRLAGLSPATGLATSLNQASSATVIGLALDGTTLYLGLAGAGFSTVGTEFRTGLASVDTGTGLLNAWNPALNDGVKALKVSDGQLFAGGAFLSSGIGNATRGGFAEIAADGTITPWSPNTNLTVNAIALSPDEATLYIAGTFTAVGGQTRNRIAAIDTATGTLTAWNPDMNGTVASLAVSPDGSVVYAGGDFTTVGVLTRNRIAAIDTSTGLATAWDPNASSTVSALAVSSDGSILYTSGFFTTIGGQTRNRIAAIDTATGLATAWDPNSNAQILSLAISADDALLYAGGSFTTIGVQSRNLIAAIDTDTGLATDWNPSASSTVSALAISPDGSTVYAGGSFTTIGGQARNRLAAIDASTSLATDWDPSASSSVVSLAFSDDGSKLYAGGNFSLISSIPHSFFAQFTAAAASGGGGGHGQPVVAPKVTVTSPNGGESLVPGETKWIEWRTEGRIDLVNILFSANGGQNWTELAHSIQSSGIYAWTVPDIQTEEALIRIEATDNAIIFAEDESDAFFTITGTMPPPEVPTEPTPTPTGQPVAPGTLLISPFTNREEAVDRVSPGDLIHSPHYRGIYYVTESFVRRPFIDSAVIFTYVDDLSSVREVTDVTLSTLPVGGPMPPRVGTVLIQFDKEPGIYALMPGSSFAADPVLRHIDSPSIAKNLFGIDWYMFVLPLDPSRFTFFTLAAPLLNSDHADSTKLIRYDVLVAKVERFMAELMQAGYLRNGMLK